MVVVAATAAAAVVVSAFFSSHDKQDVQMDDFEPWILALVLNYSIDC